MGLTVNLHHLANNEVSLQGELSISQLDIETRDEMIQLKEPLQYDLEVEKLDNALLVQGQLQIRLGCKCVRCLKPFDYLLDLTDWACHVPLNGEEAAPVVSDCVDLTPFVREDILLSFPQHPLCDPQCKGLLNAQPGKGRQGHAAGPTQANLSAWAELNKLKF
jgi:uncharacterized protein